MYKIRKNYIKINFWVWWELPEQLEEEMIEMKLTVSV